MVRRASLGSCVLLVLLACDGEDAPPGGKGDESARQSGDDALRRKLDAYLRQAALEDSFHCKCEGGSDGECEDLDLTSEETRDCYVEEARDEEEAMAAFLDCATPIMKRYLDCMNGLDSCEDQGAEQCESDYAEMLRCPAPSRDVLLAWRECDEF